MRAVSHSGVGVGWWRCSWSTRGAVAAPGAGAGGNAATGAPCWAGVALSWGPAGLRGQLLRLQHMHASHPRMHASLQLLMRSTHKGPQLECRPEGSSCHDVWVDARLTDPVFLVLLQCSSRRSYLNTFDKLAKLVKWSTMYAAKRSHACAHLCMLK